MNRLSFRPRPLDIHKKLPILKSYKDIEDEENPSSITRNSQLLREVDNEVQPQVPSKKSVSEIPTPQFLVVDTYERDYTRTFNQPASYLRGRGARAELGEFVEYDLDNEDDDWLNEFDEEKMILSPEKLESIIFKLEVLDHKTRERAGVITPTLGLPVPVLLQLDAAIEALQSLPINYGVFQAIYSYWKNKIPETISLCCGFYRLEQPPPPVNDTNLYNVFRPREKAHRLHTRRMQRRENNAQSFEKLRQVRRNLDQAKTILEVLIKREEKKRDFMASEVSLQRVQLKYKHETELLEDSLALSGFPLSTPYKFGSSEDEFMDSDGPTITSEHKRPLFITNARFTESNLSRDQAEIIKQVARRLGWLHRLNPNEPVMMFTKPLIPNKLAAAGIIPPVDKRSKRARFQGRIGRGGRIVFDRWNPLKQTHINCGNSFYIAP